MYKLFSRGDGPLISVLLPTRGRTQGLYESLRSLLNKMYDRSAIEIILKIDDDDKVTVEFVKDLTWAAPLKVVCSPRGRGYWNVHDWLHEMARHAAGDWFLNWSDDAFMQTPHWDAFFHQICQGGPQTVYPDGIFLYLLRNPDRPGNHEFFAVRREVFNVLGHLSLSPHADTWLATVMKIIERCAYTEIMVKHDNDGMHDKVAEERRAVTAQTVPILCSPEMSRARLTDAAKLLDYIEGRNEK